ncbi:ABC transporter substrate-binding protein [Luedemannella flava]
MAAAAVLPVALGAAACGDDEKGSGKTEISIFWWGAESRATTTQKALDLYTSKHPDVVFKPTWQGNQGYFEKLATQAAGGNAPDIFQMDDNFLGEYSARGIAMDLSDLVASKKIDTSSSRRAWPSTARSTASRSASPPVRTPPPWSTTRPCWLSSSCRSPGPA